MRGATHTTRISPSASDRGDAYQTRDRLTQKQQRGFMGFLSALTIVFIVLKFCGVISWPWLLVFTPLIIEALIGVALICLGVFWKLYGK